MSGSVIPCPNCGANAWAVGPCICDDCKQDTREPHEIISELKYELGKAEERVELWKQRTEMLEQREDKFDEFYNELERYVQDVPVASRIQVLYQMERDANTLFNKISALIGASALETYLHVK